jgi:plasmid maintenance system antidote protein VapI
LGWDAQNWLQMQDNFNLHQAKKELDLSEYEPLELAG